MSNGMNPQLNFTNNNLQNMNGQNQFNNGNNIQIGNAGQANQAALLQAFGVIYFSLWHRRSGVYNLYQLLVN